MLPGGCALTGFILTTATHVAPVGNFKLRSRQEQENFSGPGNLLRPRLALSQANEHPGPGTTWFPARGVTPSLRNARIVEVRPGARAFDHTATANTVGPRRVVGHQS